MNGALSAALAGIESGPAGPQVGAFFDLDGTIVSGFTAAAFYSHRVRALQVGAGELARTAALVVDSKLGGDQGRLGDVGISGLAGQAEEDLRELGERLFVQKIATSIRPQARELIRAHQRRGHTVVIASSATHFQVDPVAADVGVDTALCSEVEVENGLLTGRFDRHGMLWGEAKARAVRRFAQANGVDLPVSHAYGNGSEDVAFLSSVGRAHAVNPQAALQRVAERESWPVLHLEDPAGVGLRSVLGTVAAIGGLNLALGIGMGIGLLRGDRRMGNDLALSLGFVSFLALAGVRLNVVGEANLWAQRPAVFVMNHQSGLDAIIVAALLRQGFSGMGKQEAKYSPPTYLTGQAMDAVFIDRTDPAKGRAGQEALIERLRSGLSVFVAPEGTRSPTPILGSFRTGAFHIAMDAGVPMIPIVLRNAYDLNPGSAKIIRPGVVDVAVLDPIPTGGWTKETIRKEMTTVRNQFLATLKNWPTG